MSLSPDPFEEIVPPKETYAVAPLKKFLHDYEGPIFDVRSPCEYVKGHIPGSISFPLFTDEERAVVGTTYKQKSREDAITVGLGLVGPKLEEMATTVRKTMKEQGSSLCRILCFRGGMRSRSVQWLCQLLGFDTVRLDGGYKGFRRAVLETLDEPVAFTVIGGCTGSGKTEMLQDLEKRGLQVLDLERLANHRGSAFGLLPGVVQPTTEQFENLIAEKLWKFDKTLPVYVEDESRLVGTCMIPKCIYDQMDKALLFWLDVDFQERLTRIMKNYGSLPKEWMIEKALKLNKRLGPELVKKVVEAIESQKIQQAAAILLEYYDKAYLYSKSKHDRPTTTISSGSIEEIIQPLQEVLASHTLGPITE